MQDADDHFTESASFLVSAGSLVLAVGLGAAALVMLALRRRYPGLTPIAIACLVLLGGLVAAVLFLDGLLAGTD